MSTTLWMNVPLMLLAFGLMVGIPLWMVLRHPEWHGKRRAQVAPTYLARGAAPAQVVPVQVAAVPVPRPGYDPASPVPTATTRTGAPVA